jgi:small subunit ribosomal protein S13
MIRLLGVDLPRNKKVYISLTSIYGIGRVTSLKLLKKANIDPNKKVHQLLESETILIRNTLENTEYKFEGDLRRLISLNVRRLIDINCYRGRRHIKGLPVRGQRSRTNSRTSRLVRIYSKKKVYAQKKK